jgi:hypothetical protein
MAWGFFHPQDREPLEEMLATFRKVRKARQTPAHAVRDDDFSQEYFKSQRDTIIEAYDAVRTLRLILANDPAVEGYKVQDWLQEGRIWTRRGESFPTPRRNVTLSLNQFE